MISAIAPWYGSNRMQAKRPGRLLKGCSWVGIPFAGGMSELKYIDARTVLVNDLHRHIINLARMVADNHEALIAAIDSRLVHPDELAISQANCLQWDEMPYGERLFTAAPDELTEWAADYFVCAWMARNGLAGTDSEFRAGLAFRWEAGGGDSAVRVRNATDSIREWHKIARRCVFSCIDAFDFVDEAFRREREGHGIYVDAPWPDDGDSYKHKFDEKAQRRLAASLAEFKEARIVVRFGDHPLIRELYPEDRWRWIHFDSRTAANKAKAEVLLVNAAVPAMLV